MSKPRSKSNASIDDPLTLALAPPPNESDTERGERLQREAEAKRISDSIDEELKQEKAAWKKNKSLFKLLLLGQSESGKSTTLKNLQLTFAPQAWKTESTSWRAVIQLNLIRTVNIILDALANELSTSRPSSAAGSDAHSRISHAGSVQTSDHGSLLFTSKHALLKLRLAPLRHVENDLKQSLGAASTEVTSSDGSDDEQAVQSDRDDVGEMRSRSPGGADLFLRSNRSWREALHVQYRSSSKSRGKVDSGSAARLSGATEVIAGCCEDIQALWEDEVVRAMLRIRKIRVGDSSVFFLDNVERIASRGYEPSDDDIVRARLRTLGVQEYCLKFENPTEANRAAGKEWRIYDVGGSRSSRAAWLPYFDDANAVLFLAPISCFDEYLAEDAHVNRLEDSVLLWKSVIQSKLLSDCIIIHLHQKFREQHKELSPKSRRFYGYITSVIDTKATSTTLSSGCGRTVWRDPDGSFSSYCGTTHREAAALARAARRCKNCKTRPAYVESGKVHSFCGKRCAKEYRASDASERTPRSSPAPVETGILCKLAGCKALVHVGKDGFPGEFCSNKHRLDAIKAGKAEACLFCTKWPKAMVNGRLSDFCSKACSQDTLGAAPIILNIPNRHKAYASVSKQFTDGWRHPTSKPTVIKIWKIYGDKRHSDRFSRYKLAVERRTGLSNGNSRRRWHGTSRSCLLGDNEYNQDLCSARDCSLCSIIRSSFELAQAGNNTNFGRFGAGIYTSATSSKANDYVKENGGSPYRAALLNDVVLGKAKKLFTGDTSLTAPPQGYDSVIGEPGGDLNYDESIVYKNEAICPLFLIIYRN
ncbi:uncharacterized protein FIBRA_03135 [Fibroporia radiculosa]|uniref:PARP catalytic domain-containing protein n=1 Tax=Fibroporia radiculosa TaxID=599839 RepID=J4HVT8_9APHY|nr:uncharacterized protein FIBRA_03135 [Fibroporia radiculosa]CCM01087.1 predicted protein [Fibroporia radiculosa]